jgi:methylthioribose-1-phosphate isomerase
MFDQPLLTIEIPLIGEDVRILDQTLLPHRIEHVMLRDVSDVAEAIAVMRVRGAPLIGATAACGMALAARANTGDAALLAAAEQLRSTRPTAINLDWALRRCLNRLLALPERDRVQAGYEEALSIAREDAAANQLIGEYGLTLLHAMAEHRAGAPVRILTHCNAGWLATTYLGTATAPMYLAKKLNLPIHVYIDETRPRNQGAALTAWELSQQGIPCEVIADNAGGLLLQRGEVDMVITGADRVAANGDVCNKIGTYLKALAARESDVPFCVAVPTSTIDPAMPDGASIPIEERNPNEVLTATGIDDEGVVRTVRTAAEGVEGRNPAFDITPASLVTTLITERGLIKPEHAGALIPAE